MAVCCSTRKELTCVLLNRILHFRKTSTKGGSLKQKTITWRVHSVQAKQQTHVRINFDSSNDEQHTKCLILKLAIGILFQCYKISNHLKRKINSKAWIEGFVTMRCLPLYCALNFCIPLNRFEFQRTSLLLSPCENLSIIAYVPLNWRIYKIAFWIYGQWQWLELIGHWLLLLHADTFVCIWKINYRKYA